MIAAKVVPPPYRANKHVRTALAIGIFFTMLSVLGAIFGQSLGPDTSTFVPIAASIWSLCDILTAFFLLIRCYVTGRLAFGIIGVAYAFSGLLTWPYSIAYMILVRTVAPAVGNQQVPATLYLTWHLAFALLVGFAYLYETRGPRILQHPRIVVIRLTAGVIIAATVVAASTILCSSMLPHFVIKGIFQPVYSAVGMPAIILASAAGCALLIARGRRRGNVTLWLTVALYTSLLDAVLNVVSPVRSSYAWDLGKIMTVMSSCILMGFLLLENVRLYLTTSRAAQARTDRDASRMRALWQISTSESLSESAYLQMILDVATAHVRTGREVLGVLSHVVGEEIIVDACAVEGTSAALARAAAAYAPGTSFPASDDVHAVLRDGGRTFVWQRTDEPAKMLWETSGLRYVIGAPISIGNQTHFVTFGLLEPLADDPFLESDIAFVDVVASNIGHRFHQRSQLEKLQYQIEHDTLTALYNRTQFNRFGRLAAMEHTLDGIIVLNLDDFRRVNERLGQMTGDEVILEIASALARVDERDLVARLGGDLFAVLLRSNDLAPAFAQRVQAYEGVFRHPFHTGDRDGKVFVDVTASLGAAHCTSGKSAFDETLANANVALDAAKMAGGNGVVAFGPELQSLAIERSLEREEIASALRNDEFFLEYQPSVEMTTRRITACEALVRWNHPVRGILPPAAFLATVTRAHLLVEMTAWILHRIVRDLNSVALPERLRCYFNVPTHVLENEKFANDLAQMLTEHPQLCNRLGLELTESDMMNKVERAIETLKRLRGLGLRVAIDDFGTGYSSLSYLKRLPIDVVKLDKSFIDGLPGDSNDTALATMFLTLTKQLGLISVAEGIETETQAAWLLAEGCMAGQGYLFDRPLGWSDFAQRLRAQDQHAVFV